MRGAYVRVARGGTEADAVKESQKEAHNVYGEAPSLDLQSRILKQTEVFDSVLLKFVDSYLTLVFCVVGCTNG